MKTQTDPHGITITYNYDAANRLTTVTDTKGGTRTYTFDDADRLSNIQFTDSTAQLRLNFLYNNRDYLTEIHRFTDTAATTLVSKTIFGHDDGGRITSITHRDSANNIVNSFTYTWDAANRTVTETSTLGPSRSYQYDRAGQLLGDGTQSFTWDLNGNPTGGSYSTGTGNRVTTDGTWNYTWDDEGNLVSKVKIATTETWLYYYDHDNHLVKADHKATSGGAVDLRVEYKFDVFGQRVEKSVDSDGDGAGVATVTKFAYENGNVWADLTSAGSLTTRRIYGFGLDSLIARIGSSGNEDWYLLDKLGSVRDIVNSAGVLIDHLAYKAFGEILTETQPTNGDRYKFTAQEWDSEFSLYLFGHRYLDPKLRRFISEDPLGFGAGDANLYRYVGNGPTNGTDPTGLDYVTRERNGDIVWVIEERHWFRNWDIRRVTIGRFVESRLDRLEGEQDAYVLLNAAFGSGRTTLAELQDAASTFWITFPDISSMTEADQYRYVFAGIWFHLGREVIQREINWRVRHDTRDRIAPDFGGGPDGRLHASNYHWQVVRAEVVADFLRVRANPVGIAQPGFFLELVGPGGLVESVLAARGGRVAARRVRPARPPAGAPVANHHAIPHSNNTYNHEANRLVQAARVNLQQYAGNQRDLINHVGRHEPDYHLAVQARMDAAWARLNTAAFRALPAAQQQAAATAALDGVITGIFRDIGNGTLWVNSRPVWLP